MTVTEDVQAPVADGRDQGRAEGLPVPDFRAAAPHRRRWPRLLAALVALWVIGLVAGLSLSSLGDRGSVETTEIAEPGPADPPADRSTSNAGGAEPFSAPAPASSAPALTLPSPSPSALDPTAAPTTAKPTTTAAPTTTAKPTTTTKPTTTAAPVSTAKPAPAPTAAPTGGGDAQIHQQILKLVNDERTKAGCAALTLDGSLTAAATAHSLDMATQGYFSHTGLNGSNPGDRARAAGYNGGGIGENIAAGYGSAEAVMAGWMNSSGHRANILNCGYRVLGVGYAAQGNHWTQMFGG